MRKLLVIHKGNLQAKQFILNDLKEMGYYLVLLSCFEEDSSFGLVDRVIVADYREFDPMINRIVEDHEYEPFIGVFGYDELTMPLVDEISKRLELKPISDYCAASYRFKDRMRIAWESNHILSPRYQIIYSMNERGKLKAFHYPIVLKPTGLLSSIGVIKANSYEETEEKLRLIMDADYEFTNENKLYSMRSLFGLGTDVIAEEYIEGEEYSAEGYVIDGKYHLIGITKKFTTTDVYFDETAHIFPALPFENQEEIHDLLCKAHEALGIANAFTHTEFKICEGRCFLIEMGARLAGDFIPRLVQYSTGINVIETAVKVRTRESIENKKVRIKKYASVCFIHAPKESYGKTYRGYDLKEKEGIKIIEDTSYLDMEETIDTPESYGIERVGHIIFECDDYKDAEAYINTIDDYVKVHYV